MKDLKLFEHKKILSNWDAEKEKWYFSVVDIIEVLTDSNNPQVYWRVLKKRLLAEGNETVTNCNALKMEGFQLSAKIGQLKMQSEDGKFYKTDVADTEQLFRLIQSNQFLYIFTNKQPATSNRIITLTYKSPC